MNPIVKFIARGKVRGLISSHRSSAAAAKSVKRDHAQCDALGGGAYSDARVYAIHKNGDMTGPY